MIESTEQLIDWGWKLFLTVVGNIPNNIELFLSVLGTGATVAVTYFVPRGIAKSQNSIALFEKRYNLYKVLYPIVDFGKSLSKLDDNKLKQLNNLTRARWYLVVYLESKGLEFDELLNIGLIFQIKKDENGIDRIEINDAYSKTVRDEYDMRFLKHLHRYETIIRQSAFLFDQEIEEELKNLVSTYYPFVRIILSDSQVKYKNVNFEDYDIDSTLQELDFATSVIENSKKAFLSSIDSILSKKILEKVEEYLRIKDTKMQKNSHFRKS